MGEFFQEVSEEKHRILHHTIPDNLLCDLIHWHAVATDVAVRQQVDDGKHGSTDAGWEEGLGLLHVVEVLCSLLLTWR